MADQLTAERLRQLVSYDRLTGEFTRLVKQSAVAASGWLDRNGHVRISVDGQVYAAHRLAFLYVTGQWPTGVVDHINGERADNRWENLRDVSMTVNQQNQRRAHKRNATGLLGVTFNKRRGKYQAQIAINGAYRYLGLYATADLAHAAYLAAKRQHHEGNTL